MPLNRRRNRRSIRSASPRLLALLGCSAALAACRPPAAPAAKPTAPTPAIRFVESTDVAGIRFRHRHGGSGRKYLPETGSSGVAWLDYDGDRFPDLYLVNCAPLPGTPPARTPGRLYRNRGDGTFEDVTAGSGLDVTLYGQGATAADYDGDGDPDLFVSCLGPNHLFRNDGGRWTDVTREAGLAGDPNPWRWHTGSAWLDYDRDGVLDLFVARYVQWTPEMDVFCGVPGGQKRYCPPVNYREERCVLYRGLGGGRFRDVSRETGIDRVPGKWFQPLVLDSDGDGWPDVAVSSDGTPTALFRNEAGKRFTDVAAESGLGLSSDGSVKAGMGIDAAAWRNDGREAVLIGNFSSEKLSLFQSAEDGLFTETAGPVGMGESSLYSLTFGVAFLDADRDGWLDAFAANGHIDDYIEKFEAQVTHAQHPLFYRNERGSRFREVGREAGPAFQRKMVARGCAVADYDRDGDPDLVVTENDGPAHLFRNDSPGGGWLRVTLRGKPGNREAIGARVELECGGVKQVRWVRAGGHFCSQSELPLLFGLGPESEAEVTVTWPRGGTSTARASAGQELELRE